VKASQRAIPTGSVAASNSPLHAPLLDILRTDHGTGPAVI
jgi:hypothetical protein